MTRCYFLYGIFKTMNMIANLMRCQTRLFKQVFAISTIVVCLYGLRYLFIYTPIPYYALDKLQLRHYFLPEFSCNQCTTFNFSFISEASSTCGTKGDPPIYLLILVLTYHSNAGARKVIRNTWGGEKSYRGVRIKTQFVFGLHQDKNLNDQPRHEKEKFNDVLQVKVYDGYRSLTEKVMMSLWWVSQHCSEVQYVLKTDDDSFNHPYRFVDYLLDLDHQTQMHHYKDPPQPEPFIGGYCFTVYPDYREGSKHYVTPDLYPYEYYPTYCSGPGYVLSMGAINSILDTYSSVKYMPMEDVYITGMVREVARLSYSQIPGVVAGWHTLTPCLLATETKNAHNIWPLHMADIWTEVLEGEKPGACRSRNVKRLSLLIVIIGLWIALLYWMLIYNRSQT